MKLVTFSAGPAERMQASRVAAAEPGRVGVPEPGRVGVAEPGRGTVADAAGLLGGADLLTVIADWASARPRLEAALPSLPRLALDAVGLLAPIPRPGRNIFCVGKNYRAHVDEIDRAGGSGQAQGIPDKPVIFSKATTAVIGAGADIDPHPSVTSELDYEGELAVIIGPGGRGIRDQDAYRHVWGYTIVNDVTARDVQRAHRQWLLGKSLDTHCPMGPWAVTADEAGDPREMTVETKVNGELRQQAPLTDLIFGIPELIATISAGITLLPGDVIATGTPAGVGAGLRPPRFLAPGDLVEITITGLGTLRNRVGPASGT